MAAMVPFAALRVTHCGLPAIEPPYRSTGNLTAFPHSVHDPS